MKVKELSGEDIGKRVTVLVSGGRVTGELQRIAVRSDLLATGLFGRKPALKAVLTVSPFGYIEVTGEDEVIIL